MTVNEAGTDRPWMAELHSVLTEVRHSPAALAACRRGLGKVPMDVPAMWPYIVRVTDRAGEHERRRVETAVHHVLTLYATHQQSAAAAMHVRADGAGIGTTIGSACRRLASQRGGDEPDDGVRRRFLAAATADSVDELVWHLRGLTTLLGTAGIPADYVRLAADIRSWKHPDARARTRRRWGLDFHTTHTEPKIETNAS